MNLALFFTCGVSLKQWALIGNLEREIKPYQGLLNHIDKIYFFTYGSKKDLDFSKNLGEKIIILPNKWKIPACLFGFLIPFFYWKILKTIDVFKTNQMAGAIPAVIAKFIFKKKLIVRTGYEWLEFLEKQKKPFYKRAIVSLWEKIAYNAADLVILSSEKDKIFIQKKFKVSDRKIRIIPNYIDTGLFKSLDLEKEKNRVVFIGRLTKQKNIANLIEAIASLPVKLTIIGQGELKVELEKLAKEKNASVEFKDKVSNSQLPEILNKAEIFVLPSLYEGCPKSLLEAMACGLPCLGCDVEGIKEIIIHKENGYLCQTEAVSIRKALVELLGDEMLRAKIGNNARQTILNDFSLEKIMEKELALYEKTFV